MIELLKVKHPEAEEMKHEEISKDKVFDWSPLYICEGNYFIVLQNAAVGDQILL